MKSVLVRNVPESVVTALRERADRRGVSMQQELLHILETAAASRVGEESPEPVGLITVRTDGKSTWRRDDIYGDTGR